jgi:hypothetical protein
MAGHGERLNEKLEALAAFLRLHGVDFDYVGIGGGAGLGWRQMFVPGGTPLAKEELDWLAAQAQRCEVIAPEDAGIPGAKPYRFREARLERGSFYRYAQESYGELVCRLQPSLVLSGRADLSFHQRRLPTGGTSIFVFNEGHASADEPQACQGLAGGHFRLDCSGGAFEFTEGKQLRLGPGESCLMYAGRRAELEQLGRAVAAAPASPGTRVELRFADGTFLRASRHRWDGTAIRQAEVSEREWREAGAGFSGHVESRFEVAVADPSRGVELSIAGPRGARVVRVGGREAGVIAWPPRTLRIGPALLARGPNVIDVALHNTLAHHARSAEFRQALARCGVAENAYHCMTEALDRQIIEANVHAENPVRFQKDIKVTIEVGHGNHYEKETP